LCKLSIYGTSEIELMYACNRKSHMPINTNEIQIHFKPYESDILANAALTRANLTLTDAK